jgi:hypothetical protein
MDYAVRIHFITQSDIQQPANQYLIIVWMASYKYLFLDFILLRLQFLYNSNFVGRDMRKETETDIKPRLVYLMQAQDPY